MPTQDIFAAAFSGHAEQQTGVIQPISFLCLAGYNSNGDPLSPPCWTAARVECVVREHEIPCWTICKPLPIQPP